MAPAETVKERALVMQDILSSFDAEALPSETCPTILNNVVQNMGSSLENRPQSNEWTIQNDLLGTLLQRAAYNTTFWEAVSDLQKAEPRAVIFGEKIKKRLKGCIAEYDKLAASPPPNATAITDAVTAIANKLWENSSILTKDRERRQYEEVGSGPESATALTLLETLDQVCHRNQPITPPGHHTRRSSTTNDSIPSLFKLLIGTDGPKGEPFLLKALEQFAAGPLNTNLTKFGAVGRLLEETGAPVEYMEQYTALQNRASEAVQQATVSGTSGHRSGREADQRRGSKRTQGSISEFPVPPKRGRRTGGI